MPARNITVSSGSGELKKGESMSGGTLRRLVGSSGDKGLIYGSGSGDGEKVPQDTLKGKINRPEG